MATAKKAAKAAPATSPAKKATGKPRQVKNIIPMSSQDIAVYASPKVSRAMEEITDDITLYKGVRLKEIIEAVYNQGQKDGARNAITEIQQNLSKTIEDIPHRNPGKPKKK